jgi:hypothetical protein
VREETQNEQGPKVVESKGVPALAEACRPLGNPGDSQHSDKVSSAQASKEQRAETAATLSQQYN